MRKIALLLAPAAVAAVVAALVLGRGSDPALQPAADPAHTPPAQTRVVIVSRSMPEPSRPGMVLHGRVEAGPMPHAAMRGTVMTDSECTPDMAGISRCRNEVRLSSGRTIVVRHPHDMSSVPCLSPGEDVVVQPA